MECVPKDLWLLLLAAIHPHLCHSLSSKHATLIALSLRHNIWNFTKPGNESGMRNGLWTKHYIYKAAPLVQFPDNNFCSRLLSFFCVNILHSGKVMFTESIICWLLARLCRHGHVKRAHGNSTKAKSFVNRNQSSADLMVFPSALVFLLVYSCVFIESLKVSISKKNKWWRASSRP